jgi:N-acetylglucosamine-6-sulfatase
VGKGSLDIAPTVLGLMNVDIPAEADWSSSSLAPLLQGQKVPWRDHILYEYHWEWNFPATPTMLAIRTATEKYAFYHGVWDMDSFHDLTTDPGERHNLIEIPAYQERIRELRTQMFVEFERRGGLNLPIRIPTGERLDQRKRP